MLQWLKDRFEILRLSIRRPVPLFILAFFQAVALLLGLFPPPGWAAPFLRWLTAWPWYGWVIAWLAFLWLSTVEYSVHRKKRFDHTSLNFFRAYLEFLLKEGRQLFQYAGEKDFYSKIDDWQRKAVEGIAIGLGPEESKKFFQKMESISPLSKAYRESAASKSGEPLARSLEARLEEINLIRMSLPEREGEERNALLTPDPAKAAPGPVSKPVLLEGKVEPPPSKHLPPK